MLDRQRGGCQGGAFLSRFLRASLAPADLRPLFSLQSAGCPAGPRLSVSWCFRSQEREARHVHFCTNRRDRRQDVQAQGFCKLRQ